MGLCASKPDLVKVQPDDGGMLPDILRTRFVPAIRHIAPTNPWLPLLTPHQLVEISSAFRKFDRDGDGHIEPKEIKSVMSNLGCPQSDEQIKALIASVDTDGNGKIEFDEFVGIMAARMLKKDGDSEIEQAFGLFDDGSGYVSVDTIRTMLMQMGSHSLPREEVDALLSMMQVDAEGRVTMDDFRDLPCWEVPMPNGLPSMKPAPRKPVAAPVAAPQQPVRTTEAPAPAAPPPPAEAEPAAEPPAKPDEAKPDEGAAAAEGEAAPAAE